MKSMRIVIVLSALAIAACTSTQKAPPQTATTYVNSATGATVTQVDVPVTDSGDVDTKRLEQAKKDGYQVVNKDGETLFCRSEMKTGSHVQKETTCLTAKQLDAMHEQTRIGVQSYIHTNAPVQGR
jgi:hypothetical protein